MKWKSKTLLAKIETVYGTDSVPTAAANAILATDVSISPMEGQDVVRNLERPQMASDPSIPAGLFATMTFSVELVGSGALGTAPAWGPLMRACAVAQVVTSLTKVEYTPITDAHESASIYFQIDTTRHVLAGARGTVQLRLSAQGIPMLQFTMTGLFAVPSEQAKPTPDYSAWQAPTVGTSVNTPTFTIGAAPFILRDFTFDLGNQVEPRMLIGSETIQIVDKAESLSATVEAVPVSTYNPFTIARDQTLQAIALTHGTVPAKRVKLTIPSAQQARLTGYETGNQNILEWPLRFTPLPVTGNDQWKIELS